MHSSWIEVSLKKDLTVVYIIQSGNLLNLDEV